jgi:hypothetical protein
MTLFPTVADDKLTIDLTVLASVPPIDMTTGQLGPFSAP